MKTRLTILLLAVCLITIASATPAQAVSTYTKQINPLTTVTVTVANNSAQTFATKASKSGKWVARDAKCVVKHWDDPWHKLLDYKFTVKKHWEYNVVRNKVRNVDCDPGTCWINVIIRSGGGYAETYGPMDYPYTLKDGGIGHYSERHAQFHSIIGIKGFSIPIGTWTVNVKFRVFSRNRPGTNQNWRCDVTQKWKYAS
jgi:hypothetical protein